MPETYFDEASKWDTSIFFLSEAEMLMTIIASLLIWGQIYTTILTAQSSFFFLRYIYINTYLLNDVYPLVRINRLLYGLKFLVLLLLRTHAIDPRICSKDSTCNRHQKEQHDEDIVNNS